MNLVISASIIKKVSSLWFHEACFFSVPSVTPNISVIPVINGQLVSLTISVDVSFHILSYYVFFACKIAIPIGL